MSKYIDLIGWDDAPHLQPPHISKEELDDMERDMLPHQRQARRTGKPGLGAGAIYPVDTDALFIPPFKIPEHWQQGYAMDPGWKVTAGLLGAHDQDTGKYYLTAEYYGQRDQQVVHAHGIKSMLPWKKLEGVIDPVAEGSNQKDGTKALQDYEDLGLVLMKANNAVHAGLRHVLMLMETGQLKIFNTLVYLKRELALYRRNEKGKIVKENDHLMDDMRYILNTPDAFHDRPILRSSRRGGGGEW